MAKANTRTGLSSLVLSEMVELKYIWAGHTDSRWGYSMTSQTDLMTSQTGPQQKSTHRHVNRSKGGESCMLGRKRFPVEIKKEGR